jgi:hypothetical protein
VRQTLVSLVVKMWSYGGRQRAAIGLATLLPCVRSHTPEHARRSAGTTSPWAGPAAKPSRAPGFGRPASQFLQPGPSGSLHRSRPGHKPFWPGLSKPALAKRARPQDSFDRWRGLDFKSFIHFRNHLNLVQTSKICIKFNFVHNSWNQFPFSSKFKFYLRKI